MSPVAGGRRTRSAELLRPKTCCPRPSVARTQRGPNGRVRGRRRWQHRGRRDRRDAGRDGDRAGVVSLSAGGYVTVTDGPGRPVLTIDGGIEMPGRDRPAEWFGGACRAVTTGYGGGVSMIVGHGSAGTPGALSALEFLHRRAGGLPRDQVVAVSTGRRAGRLPARLGGSALPRLRARERVRLVAAELRRPARGRRDAHRGLLGRADLAAYRPVPRPALTVRRAKWTVTTTNPAPAIGGVAVAAMLELLDGHPGPRWTKADLARLIDVQETVLGYRVRSFQAAPDRIAAAARLLELVQADDLGAISSPSTARVSVAGDDGVACAVTVSAGYGSGVLTPGTGIWQNNCLGELELNHGGLHTLSPGDRLLSNMAPTIAAKSRRCGARHRLAGRGPDQHRAGPGPGRPSALDVLLGSRGSRLAPERGLRAAADPRRDPDQRPTGGTAPHAGCRWPNSPSALRRSASAWR